MPQQTLQFPLTGGISQKTAQEYIDPNARVVDAVNCVFTHDGSAEKRLGLQALATTQVSGDPTMGAPIRVFGRQGEILSTDGAGLFSWSPNASEWSYRGNLPECMPVRSHIFGNTASGFTSLTVAETGVLRFMAMRNWTSGSTAVGDIFATITDISTGANVGPTLVTFTTNHINYCPRLVTVGTRAYLFAADTGGNINVWIWSAGTWTGPSVLVSDLDQPNFFDAVPYSNGNGILVVYSQNASGTPKVRYLRLEALPALTISFSGIVDTGTGGNHFAHICAKHDATIGLVAIGYDYHVGSNYTTRLVTYTSAFGSFRQVTPVDMTGFTNSPFIQFVLPVDANHVMIGGQFGVNATTPGMYAQWNMAGATQDFQQFMGSHGNAISTAPAPGICIPIAEPFRAIVAGTTRVYLPIVSGGTLISNQSTAALPFVSAVLLDITTVTPRAVAVSAARQIDALLAPGAWSYDNHLPVTTGITTTGAITYRHPIPVNPSEEFAIATFAPTLGHAFFDLVEWNFSQTIPWQPTEASGQLYLSGGIPGYDEGTGFRELAFLEWPTLQSVPSVAGTGGLLTAGTYGYALCWVDQDGEGLVWRSAPYFCTATTSTATSKVTLTVYDIPWTYRTRDGRGPLLEIYRTQVNGTSYQFLGTVVAGTAGPHQTLSYVDTVADSTIVTNTVLYTAGGILQAENPPSLRCMVRARERLHGIDDTGFNIYFSTAFGGGPESGDAPYFNDSLTLQFPDEQLTALAVMDDKVIMFSASHIWYLQGNYPDNLGNGGSIAATQVPSDVGTPDWRSLVLVPTGASPGGIMFQATTGGIYLLDRGLNVTYIGKDVQDLTLGQTVVSASLAAASSQVRFALSNAGAQGTGVVVTFDYILGRWARNTQYFANSGDVLSACSLSSTGQWVAAINGQSPTPNCVATEFAATSFQPWYDKESGGAKKWVTSSVTLGTIKPGGLQSQGILGQCTFLGRWLDAADITMTLSYNYGATSESQGFAHSVLAAANATMAQGGRWPAAANTWIEALSVTLADAQPADATDTTGRGIRWLTLAVDVVPLPGRYQNMSPTVTA